MFTTFQEVEAFFDSRKSLGIKPGLDRIHKLLHLIDNPQRKIQAVHVAGTNGKGSTVQYIKNALQANGYKVGVFTSPSLTGLTGHLYLGDKEISKEAFLILCNEIYPAVKQMDEQNVAPTEFEIITAIGFLFFSRSGDIALIETGMGGREDTTNCFQPLLSIITNVAKDHTGFLGNTIAEIAYQKAGIIKSGAPVILGEVEMDALSIIDKEAASRKTAIYRYGIDFSYRKDEKGKMIWKSNQNRAETVLHMYGAHQMQNASIAFMALEKLSDAGYTLSSDIVEEAIGNTTFAGRFEIVNKEPVIILDGAHNPAGIDAFIKTADEIYPDEERHIMFAAFKDKDLDKMLEQIGNRFMTITLTSFDHPRAAQAAELERLHTAENRKVTIDWKDAVDEMLQTKSGIYFITGSLNFISLVRAYILTK
ncbi:bifunctional folylpolyglutamate synthase/dihydrofolate synthase [Oceanobacillus saliphilus]|uniref:bifunctional folylpolyglutamate synthase/dihydrofolate synthase n=1 Tax=Oceanobacillus saliphilus TaxID=2925834 RepID=UPI00201D79AB|nr:folylpolyglutamate synthase/dihydrofolate synthase family protein [Oceanobacillus saliphilus]